MNFYCKLIIISCNNNYYDKVSINIYQWISYFLTNIKKILTGCYCFIMLKKRKYIRFNANFVRLVNDKQQFVIQCS